MPRDWVFAELFKRLEKGERPAQIFKLCDGMYTSVTTTEFSCLDRSLVIPFSLVMIPITSNHLYAFSPYHKHMLNKPPLH